MIFIKVIVASRESTLAVVQSNIVINAIKQYDENIDASLLTMKTKGDIILDKTLDKIGGKGLFIKELEKALYENRADISVHSYKDMPMQIDECLPIVAVSEREDPRDVLILPQGVKELDFAKPIGCSSKRRQIQLKKIYPNIKVEPVRGNVQTRLKKLDDGEFSALVLAYAGIKRLGLESRVSRIFSVEEIIPAACQGVLCVQARKGFDSFFLNNFNCKNTQLITDCERAFVRTLDGGCSSPVAAYATINGDEITLTGFYVDEKENAFIKTVKGSKFDGEKIGVELAKDLKGGKNNG